MNDETRAIVIKQMLSGVHTAEYYPIRRCFGYSIFNASLDSIIAFIKQVPALNAENRWTQNAGLITASLMYQIHYPKDLSTADTWVTVPEIISRLYHNSSASTQKQIENLLNADDLYGDFAPCFARILKQAIKYLRPGEDLSYVNLFKDLCYWSNENRWTRLNWIKVIIQPNNTKTEEKN